MSKCNFSHVAHYFMPKILWFCQVLLQQLVLTLTLTMRCCWAVGPSGHTQRLGALWNCLICSRSILVLMNRWFVAGFYGYILCGPHTAHWFKNFHMLHVIYSLIPSLSPHMTTNSCSSLSCRGRACEWGYVISCPRFMVCDRLTLL